MTTETTADAAELPPRPTVKQSAAFMNVDERTVRNHVAKGHIKAYRVGPTLIRLDRDSVIAFASRPLIAESD